jgi:hypothetical protein
MSSRVRYGDLMDQVAGHIAHASTLLRTHRLPATAGAIAAIAAYRRLLAALHRHGWQLLGGDNRQLSASPSVARTTTDTAAARLLDALKAAAGQAARTDVAAEAAGVLRLLCSPSAAHTELTEVELARPAIRTDQPTHELADRLARLHRGAWQLVREPHVGVTTLIDYAALGVIVHAHTAALLTAMARPDSDGRSAAAEPLITGIKHSGAAWRRLHRHLADLCTATPGSPGVQRDVQRVQSLLRDHIPLHPSDGTPEPVAPDRQLVTTTLGALRSLSPVAGWNARVLDHLVATRQLHIEGSRLTGDEVTNRADLVAAKLSASLVPAPPDRLLTVRDAYRSVQDTQQPLSATGEALRSALAPAVPPSLVDRSPTDRANTRK